MEAIVELIAALCEALFLALFALIEAMAALLAVVVEFLFLAVTQGISAAAARYKQRSEERQARSQSKTDAKADRSTGSGEHSETGSGRGNVSEAALSSTSSIRLITGTQSKPLLTFRQSAVILALVVGAIVCGVVTWKIRDSIRKKQIAQTRTQIAKLADSFSNQVKNEQTVNPTPGVLPDRDVWGQPIELFVDKVLLGSLIVVRSAGPDGKSGSVDDLLATRVVRASAKKVGGELAKRGVKALRERVSRLLPGRDKEKLPAEADGAKTNSSKTSN